MGDNNQKRLDLRITTPLLVSLSLVAPDVVDQVYHLSQQLPQAVQRLEAYFAQYEGGREILAQKGSSTNSKSNIKYGDPRRKL
ncbi:hypothetical protein Nhal_1581 [Nitrosococcus halophilus Nc 4]|uniref:Uncharacterized protein n=1 Tax=Nitrosococcus halophilus (strain Nc4) TaxID=472759 RepID=D5C1T3_NITHN|nr:hypothetical protein Nhal_1581 [Nitrosococcus halophilus Nc 4]